MNLIVNRSNYRDARVEDAPTADLEPGQARLVVERFGLTANNITYAVIGDMLQYWDFFPAPEGWGRVPVWGYARIVETADESVTVGQRVFGFLPMSSELVVDVGRANARGFTDVAAHRAPMAAAYNHYRFVEPAATADRIDESRRMLLQPLFFTSFLVDDFLADNDHFGAAVLVISSASAKTASGIARLAARREGLTVVGLTSPGNLAFTEELGVYDTVIVYGDEADLPDGPAAYVDVSGSAAARTAIHARYGDDLTHDMILGGTHHDEIAEPAQLPGPAPELFFAPSQVAKRTEEWGTEMLDTNIEAAWAEHAPWVAGWMTLEELDGPEALAAAWVELFDNQVDPSTGFLPSLATDA